MFSEFLCDINVPSWSFSAYCNKRPLVIAYFAFFFVSVTEGDGYKWMISQSLSIPLILFSKNEGWFLNFRHFSIWEWKNEHQSTMLNIMVGRLAKAWKWFRSPCTKTIGSICEKPTCQLLNDEFAEFIEFINLPSCFCSFIKTWAIGMGWVGRAWNSFGESETMVSENSPAGAHRRLQGAPVPELQCALGNWVGS